VTKSKIEEGKKAPGFTLLDQDKKKVSLSDFRGSWVVLYFYPKDDTPGCTTEACEFTDGIQDFRALNAAVLGCSPDSPEKHQKFIAKYDLEVRLLSDSGHEVMEAYGAWGEKNMYGKVMVGVIRSTVIIDPEGRVAHRWKRVKAKGHAEKVRERLEQLQSS
jgi:peroxiredoxin Q/BCP